MVRRSLVTWLLLLAAWACSRPQAEAPGVIRLVDEFAEARVDSASETTPPKVADSPAEAFEWAEIKGAPYPLLRAQRTTGEGNPDVLHHAEVKIRVSKGGSLALNVSKTESMNVEGQGRNQWPLLSPLVPGERTETYVLTPSRTLPSSDIRYLFLSPSSDEEAEYELESVRLVFRREYLESVPSGVSWQGFGNVYRETIVTRSPEKVSFDLELPETPRFEIALGTIEPFPVTFLVEASPGGVLLKKTLTTPNRWEETIVPLEGLGGQEGKPVTLTLTSVSEKDGALGFWGAPSIRASATKAKSVILFVGDTLRRDHLELYGYDRETAPNLSRIAREGALFLDAQSQATWTKVSMPSILTSLYPTTHGVKDFPDRVPASALTLAEAYRDAGYATLAYSSNTFVGPATNLHQGFEVFVEDMVRPVTGTSKSARAYLDRALPWIEAHRDVPFFLLIHVTDPHWPFPPEAPYDTKWADAADRERHREMTERVRGHIQRASMKRRGLPRATELASAGVDAAEFVKPELDWYDGSIRGMDAEIGRLLETLENLGLDEQVLLAFLSDHGEEFLEHGSHWHGQSLYGELTNVPLVLWSPGRIPAGLEIRETVQSIDVMPTLLELSSVPIPEGLQGQSLFPLLQAEGVTRWRARPAFSERHPSSDAPGTESIAMVWEGYKLVRNIDPPEGQPEIELYDHVKDPLNLENIADQKPEVVEKLGKMLEDWQRFAQSARLPTDGEAASGMSSEQLERLRSLGYVQ